MSDVKKQPNILFVFPDQLRGDWIEPVAEVPVRTPNVARLGRRGVTFSRAWTPSPVCAPARACLAKVVDYDRSPVQHNNQNMPMGDETLYSRLADAGYAVATAGKLDLLKGFMDWGASGTHPIPGGDRLRALGFTGGVDNAGKHDALRGRERGLSEPYMNHLASLALDRIHLEDFKRREPAEVWMPLGETMRSVVPPPPAYANTELSPLPESAYCDNWIGEQGAQQLTRLLDGDQPWFLTVNFAGPHEPLDVTADMRARWQDVDFPPPHGQPGSDAALQNTIRQNYAAMIERVDDWLGRYVAMLDDRGALENTLVVFASDHGEMLGDLNIWGKQVHFEGSLHVPLVMAGPGCRPQDAPRGDLVSLLDVAQTFLDYAGTGMSESDGLSLRGTLETGAPHTRKLLFSGLGNWRAVTDGQYKLVAGFREDVIPFETQFQEFDAGSIDLAALYDTAEDPWETRDIARKRPDLHERLCDALRASCARHTKHRPAVAGR